jgi:hypothetical protein
VTGGSRKLKNCRYRLAAIAVELERVSNEW